MYRPSIRPEVEVSVFGVALLLLATGCGSPIGGGHNIETFTPPEASVVEKADCLLPEIQTPLAGAVQWPQIDAPPTITPGYPPDDFEPVAIVRCERGEDPNGQLTIDAIHMEGQVDDVYETFRTLSQRFAGSGSGSSCAVDGRPPVGLWLVNRDDHAIRPQWPTTPCGYDLSPLDALATLHEVKREQNVVDGLAADNAGVCPQTVPTFSVTIENNPPDERQQYREATELATPIADVGRLQICRFANADVPVEESRNRLTADQSRTLMQTVVQLPLAPPCEQSAQRYAVIELLRPDGSGGTHMQVELDGCKRLSLGGYSATTDSLIAALTLRAE